MTVSTNTSFNYSNLNTPTSTAAAPSSSSPSSSSSSTNSSTSMTGTQTQFMQLLVAQLQSQDPMNPMDNSQMTSQIAQINTVTGINQLNTTMNSMASLYAGTQVMQAANLIGKQVLAPGTAMNYDGKNSTSFMVNVPANASGTKVSVVDSKGNVVATIPVPGSAVGAGNTSLTWNGAMDNGQTAPAGAYTLVASASVGGSASTVPTCTWQNVKSVAFGSSGVTVNLASGQQTGFGNIVQIQNPAS